jgi:hypothetical protein
MKNSISIRTQKHLFNLYNLLGFCILLHFAIDSLVTHSYSSSVNNKNHCISLRFYCVFIAFLIANLRRSMTLCVAFVLENNCMSVPKNEKSTLINCLSVANSLFFTFKKRCFTDTPAKTAIQKSEKNCAILIFFNI